MGVMPGITEEEHWNYIGILRFFWLAFALWAVSGDKRNCDDLARTQFAKKGLLTYREVAERLNALGPMLNSLQVKEKMSTVFY